MSIDLGDERLNSEYHYAKNAEQGVDPLKLTRGSGIKVWWVCRRGHEWQATPNSRTSGNIRTRDITYCPFCVNKRVLGGFNDLASQCPELMEEWSPRNIADPSKIISKSAQRVWWVCALGHEWESVICSRALGKANCPYCSHHKVWAGFNDLASQCPELVKEWSTRNTMNPNEISPQSNRKVWWACALDHEWEATPNHRVSRGGGCPFCSNHRVLAGFNDLASQRPEFLTEWSPRNTIKPDEITPKSGQKVWWKCSYDHEWEATVHSRVGGGNGCPRCASSQIERDIYASLCLKYENVFQMYTIPLRFRRKSSMVVDIYLEVDDNRYVIEYDGGYWHRERTEIDIEKSRLLLSDGYVVMRIRESHAKTKLPGLGISGEDYFEIESFYSQRMHLRNHEVQRLVDAIRVIIDGLKNKPVMKFS